MFIQCKFAPIYINILIIHTHTWDSVVDEITGHGQGFYYNRQFGDAYEKYNLYNMYAKYGYTKLVSTCNMCWICYSG